MSRNFSAKVSGKPDFHLKPPNNDINQNLNPKLIEVEDTLLSSSKWLQCSEGCV